MASFSTSDWPLAADLSLPGDLVPVLGRSGLPRFVGLPVSSGTRVETMLAWLAKHHAALAGLPLLSTADFTAHLRADPRTCDLEVRALNALANCGDIQLAERVLAGEVSAVLFCVDEAAALTTAPDLRPWPHGPPDLQSGGGPGGSEYGTGPDPLAAGAPAAGECGGLIIVASGGDGTVSAVAGAVIGTDIPLAVIPRGTANAFSSALGPGPPESLSSPLLAPSLRPGLLPGPAR